MILTLRAFTVKIIVSAQMGKRTTIKTIND